MSNIINLISFVSDTKFEGVGFIIFDVIYMTT